MADDEIEIDLSIDAEQAFYVLTKARAFDELTATPETEDGSDAADDDEVAILQDGPDDPTYLELMSALEDLNEDEQLDLVALMWVGRGDFDIGEWDEARRQAAEMSDRHIPRYLAQTPLLGDFVEEGLSQAGVSLDEFEADHL